eukprot:g806.t1
MNAMRVATPNQALDTHTSNTSAAESAGTGAEAEYYLDMGNCSEAQKAAGSSVRSEPSNASSILRRVPDGTMVRAVPVRRNTWLELRNAHGRQCGYVRCMGKNGAQWRLVV